MDLTEVSNGAIEYSAEAVDSRPSGSTAMYSCNTGYTLNGINTVTCENGMWSPDAPICESRSACAFRNRVA